VALPLGLLVRTGWSLRSLRRPALLRSHAADGHHGAARARRSLKAEDEAHEAPPRAAGKRTRIAGAAEADWAPAAAGASFGALRDRTLARLQAVEGGVCALLLPLAAEAVAAWEGPCAKAAFVAAAGHGMTWRRAHSIQGAVEVHAWWRAACERRHAALHAWRVQLELDELLAPAYRQRGAAGVSPDTELDAMRVIVRCAAELTRDTCAAYALPDGSLRATEAAALGDFERGAAALSALVAMADALLAAERLGALRGFLDAASAVLAVLLQLARRSEAALTHRLAWQRDMCLRLGPAAGCAAADTAAAPPLVSRLRFNTAAPEGGPMAALAA
jgi:hypothetical protein